MAAEERKAIEDKVRKEQDEKIKASQELKVVTEPIPSVAPATEAPSAEESSEKPMQPTPPESVADSWEKASADCAEAAENVAEPQQ